jgi:hypothetical protein
MNTGMLESRSEPSSSLGRQAIEWLNKDGTIVFDDRLLQCDHAPRPEIAEGTAKGVKWIGGIHEHEAANDRVYGGCEYNLPKIRRHEANIRQASCFRSLLSKRYLSWVTVYADYIAFWSNKLSRQERNVT